ncbi:MAG: ImmA/IrrE family metallo-endopeptidase [Microcoleus sp. PH2017_01_SCD_O_A]|nr:ImmA/IrrE family metallo-endopeptidase [Microcoleus sp. PH2017_02_FOX_O_A]MCC3422828.1 ImmA/IrrE family metallo-endopeptidase [Microcoleus sp. PH2017_01_SCD_O_A]MCC3519767.1 ImmA/IrrE family metallo-endopeptidase [Microcoleus sp. PH2017_18_LLB_O_A]TAG65954.1 MAG: ImmA/IrrE family metallo-endopeptidase [Oscillatoriales cyanobacterium]
MKREKQTLAQEAMHKSIEVRTQTGFDLKSPICIYGLCDQLNVRVKFVDISSMEGMYCKEEKPRILLSALRPFPRRTFTCAHELGHYIFGHGLKVDELIEDSKTSKTFNPDEFLVDSFASFLLMPTLGVRKAFVDRGWDVTCATPIQIFTIACNFGVGYETLIYHMTYALKMLDRIQASLLLKVKPKTLREQILGYSSSEPLIIADEHWSIPTIDAEVGSQLLLPSTAEAAANQIITVKQKYRNGCLFLANRPGIVRVYCRDTKWAVFVRVSRHQFVGLSQYRHLEEPEDE